MRYQTAIINAKNNRFWSISFWGILFTTAFILAIGVYAVFSASFIGLLESDDFIFAALQKQSIFIGSGIIVMLITTFAIPRKWFDKLTQFLLFASIVLVLCTAFGGREVNGNRSWFDITSSISVQPSEFTKVFLIGFLGIKIGYLIDNGDVKNLKSLFTATNRSSVFQISAAIGASIGFTLLQKDLGTAIVMMLIVVGILYFSGVKIRYFILIGGVLAAGLACLVISAPYRVQRIMATLFGMCKQQELGKVALSDECRQLVHGKWAFAGGGFTGVGPGASREKWGYIPEGQNDFIFTIIGEELGFIGSVALVIGYLGLIILMFRVFARHLDAKSRVITAGMMVWIACQAIMNMGSAVGSLPIIGVTLPFISSGGSSIISLLTGIGVVLNLIRNGSKTQTSLIKKSRKGSITIAAPTSLTDHLDTAKSLDKAKNRQPHHKTVHKSHISPRSKISDNQNLSKISKSAPIQTKKKPPLKPVLKQKQPEHNSGVIKVDFKKYGS